MAGVDLITVHYRGAGPALPDLMSGRIQVMFDPVASSIAYIRAGKLRPLAVTTATPIDVLPDIPTIGEFVPGYEAIGWDGIGAPRTRRRRSSQSSTRKLMPPSLIPTFTARLVDLGADPFASSPAEFGKFIVEYTEKWAKVIRAANIKAE